MTDRSRPESPSVTFREHIAGAFHLGATAPADGRRQGEAARTRLALQLAVAISDVRRFMNERDQSGEVTGTIDFEPLGRDIPVSRGTFTASPPGEGTAEREVSYTLAFATRGTPYYLVARCAAPAERGEDAWVRAATLPATLHEGTDRTGPIVGAGVLDRGEHGLERLVASLRVTHADSLGDSAVTLAAFGRFFLGALWDAQASPPAGLRGSLRRLGRTLRAGLRRPRR